MWAYAVQELKLSEDQFWDLTPVQLWALGERSKDIRVREDYRAALVASILLNTNRKKGSDPVRPADLFNSLREQVEDGELERGWQTGPQMLQHLRKVAKNVKGK